MTRDLTQFLSNRRLKLVLLTFILIIGTGTLIYTNNIARILEKDERLKVELWAKAAKKINETDSISAADTLFALDIFENNSIPVIVTNQSDSILYMRNISGADSPTTERLARTELARMKKRHAPIVIGESEGSTNYIYYNDSTMLIKLRYYPWVKLLIISMFMIVLYLALSASKVSEQNRVWVGMAKETAHQLGTPISSLMAWVELLRAQKVDKTAVDEIEKDVERLNRIAERFSKVGSAPELTNTNVVQLLSSTVSYLEARSPKRVRYTCNFNPYQKSNIPLNAPLFSWVIENLCKNSTDAIDGKGEINISLYHSFKELYVDITDSGKGIPKASFQQVFSPGYTTKRRGWGLGLSLAKRIVENYHNGKIFIKNSEQGKGSTFRIVLPFC